MNIWKRQPIHAVKAGIDGFVIYQRGFCTVKGNGLLNDEVSIKFKILILWCYS